MTEDKPLTRAQFAQKVKSKYPEYKDIDDETLTTKMLEKYPEYSSTVETEGALKKYTPTKTLYNRFIQWLCNIYKAIPNFPKSTD